ncbi:18185_t:CDS:2, partial [Racocetra persica]
WDGGMIDKISVIQSYSKWCWGTDDLLGNLDVQQLLAAWRWAHYNIARKLSWEYPIDKQTINIKDNNIDNEKCWLETNWEFECQIPEWLKRIHKHPSPLWWRIVDIADPKLTEIITESEFLGLNEIFLSNLPSDWEILEPPVERCLYSIAMIRGLQKVAKTVLHYGVYGAIINIRKILSTPNETEDENPFLIPQLLKSQWLIMLFKKKIWIIQTYEMINKKIPQRENSERDIDVVFKSHMFSCFDNIMDLH